MSIASEEEYRPILEYEGYYGNVINIYNTIAEASKKTNILRTCIDNCLNGRSKTAGGYIWEYVVGGVNNVN